MNFGLIKWFDFEKGYGVIASPNIKEKEVFIHISNWKGKTPLNKLNEIPLIFTTAIQKNKLSAVNCIYFDFYNMEHWKNLLLTFGESEKLTIEHKEYDLIDLAIKKVNDSDRSFLIDKLIGNKVINANIQISLWERQVINDFAPSDDLLDENYHLISNTILEKITNPKTIADIISNKLKSLIEKFDYNVFKGFDQILPLIKDENYKNKVIQDLNKNVDNAYKEYFFKKLKSAITTDTVSHYSIKDLLTRHPSFIYVNSIKEWKQDLTNLLMKHANSDLILNLWKDNFISLTAAFFQLNLSKFDENHLDIIIGDKNTTPDLAHCIFESQIEKERFVFSLVNSKRYFPEFYEDIDKKAFNILSQEEYYKLWAKNIGNIVPKQFFINDFDNEITKYLDIERWLANKRISNEDISEILIMIIEKHKSVTNRKTFYTIYHCINTFIKINTTSTAVERILLINNDFISIILWHLEYIDSFELITLKNKFIFFTPQDQVNIFKRLFYLKYKGKLNFTFKQLDEIIRDDLNSYLTDEQFDNDFTLDISTHVIIEGINNFIENGSFLFKSDLIFKDLKRNSKKKFQIGNYFDECEGRETAEWNWNSNGKIRKVNFPNNHEKYYYAIEFEAAFEVTARNRHGKYSYHEKNPNFELFKEDIKKIPSRKWNAEEKHWGVPSNYKNEVLEFAKKHRFFVDLGDKKHYENNLHLVAFSRMKNHSSSDKNIPKGIQFCEGRKAKKPHSRYNREFWWCLNQECFQHSTINHLSENFEKENSQREYFIYKKKQIWEYYTLLDILKILELNIDEKKKDNEVIADGLYYNLLGHINAYNRLLGRLYCNECGELLFPINSSHFALHRVTTFNCENDNCKKHKEPVYLNNCLNGECTNIIDSRLSQKCSNNLYICNSCGTCCSTEMFKRRLTNLQVTGMSIDPKLLENIEHKVGHLEKKEYYCYKCSNLMTEESENSFICKSCNIEYDLSKFQRLKGKWTNINPN